MAATGVWIVRRIEPATDFEFARQAIGSGTLICTEDQFVDGEVAIRRSQVRIGTRAG